MSNKKYDPNIYASLLSQTLPGVIADKADYDRTEQFFNRLMDKGEDYLSPEEFRLFELLGNLLEQYESQTLEPLETVSPAEALRFLMDENGLKQKDLVSVFGSQAVVSKVLNGRRSISKAQAKLLAERFRLSVDLFI